MKKQVKLSYTSSWKLEFPKNSNAPMLFLEWVEWFNNQFKHPLVFKISQKKDESEILNDLFIVRLEATKENATDCYEYIKNNI